MNGMKVAGLSSRSARESGWASGTGHRVEARATKGVLLKRIEPRPKIKGDGFSTAGLGFFHELGDED